MSPAAGRSPVREALRSTLGRDSRIHAWQIRSTRSSGLQTYLVQKELEAERRTSGETHEVTVFVKTGDRLGRAVATLGPGDAGALSDRLDQAVFMAGLGGDALWTLPGAGDVPKVEVYDAALAGARAAGTSRALVEAWRSAVAAQTGVTPSSMELFCGEDAITFENSAGRIARSSATRVSLLTLLLAQGGTPSERFSWDERRRAADLDIAAIVRRVGEEARDLTRATPPPSGKYAVVIHADELTALLAPIQNHASAETLHQKSSRFEVGEPLPIPGAGGEPLTVYSNARLPYGLSSYAVDAGGVAAQRVALVKDNVFVQPWATKQHADYLGTPATGGFANWEIPAGPTALADLTAGERVLFVRSFSWLTPDAARGNFGTEVRVGYLHENGARRPVKGGTVSGNVFEALGTARWSKETVFRGDYLGPVAARFEGLTIAGV